MVPNVINRGYYINLPVLSGDVMYCNKLEVPIDAITNESPGRPKYNTLPTSLYVRIVGEGAWQIMSYFVLFISFQPLHTRCGMLTTKMRILIIYIIQEH